MNKVIESGFLVEGKQKFDCFINTKIIGIETSASCGRFRIFASASHYKLKNPVEDMEKDPNHPPIHGHSPPPAGFMPPPSYQQAVGDGQMYYPPGAATVVPVATTVVVSRGCPKCQNGIMSEVSNVVSIVAIVIAAILFFPIGLVYLFCLPASTSYRCNNCRYEC
uniref:Membrane protein BRI3 n=1 Tax=Trichuris muris TaxID=70415 RepID=A0A5S6QQG3_TRIMR